MNFTNLFMKTSLEARLLINDCKIWCFWLWLRLKIEGFFNSTKVKIEENNNASVKLFLETSIRKKTKKLMSER